MIHIDEMSNFRRCLISRPNVVPATGFGELPEGFHRFVFDVVWLTEARLTSRYTPH